MKKRSVILMIVLLTVVLVGIPMALSISSYLNPLQSVYGSGSCTTCHSSSSGGSRNDYGTLFENQPNHNTDPISALQAIGAPPGVTPLPTPTVTATPVPPSVNTIRFVTIGDTHITSDATTDQYQRLTKAVNYINSRTDIDFVVELGDVADSATSANFASAKSILDGLNKPYYVIEGNHDLGSDGTLFTQ